MEAQHTPGPLTIEHIPGLDLGATAEIMSGKTIVAQVWKTDDSILRWSSDTTGQANARLIAAAPELLKALQALMPLAGDALTATGHDPRAQAQMQDAADAIAKATNQN